MRRDYEISLEGTATIAIDDEVIERGLSVEFTEQIGKMADKEAVIEHLAYNTVVNNARLSFLLNLSWWHAPLIGVSNWKLFLQRCILLANEARRTLWLKRRIFFLTSPHLELNGDSSRQFLLLLSYLLEYPQLSIHSYSHSMMGVEV